MVQEYQPRRFFRYAPNFMLRRYFDDRNALSEVDFGALAETHVEPIYEAWLKLLDDARKEMEQDFQDIDELATEGGSRASPVAWRRPGRSVRHAHGFPRTRFLDDP